MTTMHGQAYGCFQGNHDNHDGQAQQCVGVVKVMNG